METKTILAVAVKDPLGGDFKKGELLATQEDLVAARPLLFFMMKRLEELAGGAPTPQIRAVEGRLGPGPDNQNLQDAITGYLRDKELPRPHVIVPIGSAPTRAARAVVLRLSPSNKIPIVFTVVSDPGGEPPDDPIVDRNAGMKNTKEGVQITGVSRSLIQTVRDCLVRFRDLLGEDREIHWLIRPHLHQGQKAHRELTGSSPLDSPQSPAGPQGPELKWHDITGLDGFEIQQHVEDRLVLPWNRGPQKNRTGLLVIPDELVVSLAKQIIESCQAPTRAIPVFFQQLEWVLPGPWNPQGPYALAGYGLSPETFGRQVGEYVHMVLLDPHRANELPAFFFDKEEFQFWINRSVADDLGIKIPDQVLLSAQRTFPERTGL
jgi:ABC-type uncharacterized transport system substrate-binding protein